MHGIYLSIYHPSILAADVDARTLAITDHLASCYHPAYKSPVAMVRIAV